MLFRCNQSVFIAPFLYKEGTVINYTGAIGAWAEPADAEAQAAWDIWAKANPGKAAGARPFDELEIIPRATAEVVSLPEPDADIDASGPVALPGTKAKADLSMGGVALNIKGTK